MEKLIRYSTLRSYAYSNDAICEKPIRGIVVYFSGLGSCEIFDDDPYDGKYYAEKGIIYLRPYNNPWAWMNKQAVSYTDEIIDVLIEKYNLPKTIPIVSTGLSMGGQSALIYTAKSKHSPTACVVNCPVCDVVFHFTERDDLPRTLYSSLFNETGTLEEVLKMISPLHIIDELPKVKYHIFHLHQA